MHHPHINTTDDEPTDDRTPEEMISSNLNSIKTESVFDQNPHQYQLALDEPPGDTGLNKIPESVIDIARSNDTTVSCLETQGLFLWRNIIFVFSTRKYN